MGGVQIFYSLFIVLQTVFNTHAHMQITNSVSVAYQVHHGMCLLVEQKCVYDCFTLKSTFQALNVSFTVFCIIVGRSESVIVRTLIITSFTVFCIIVGRFESVIVRTLIITLFELGTVALL